jgi:UPF0176 protein
MSKSPFSIAAFYKFVVVADALALRGWLYAALSERGMRGTILVAGEGINGTVSGTPEAMASFLRHLRSDPRFCDLAVKQTTASAHPFKRLKVKVKREILSFGHPEANPAHGTGTYVRPEHWNALISAPDVKLIDTRNDYEVAEGTFRGAIDPQTRSFRDFADYVARHLDPARDRKVAMFCTGGIRCEKATAYLKSRGFAEVYHLEGGILNYLAQIPEEDRLWQGKCFVFDERGAI